MLICFCFANTKDNLALLSACIYTKKLDLHLKGTCIKIALITGSEKARKFVSVKLLKTYC